MKNQKTVIITFMLGVLFAFPGYSTGLCPKEISMDTLDKLISKPFGMDIDGKNYTFGTDFSTQSQAVELKAAKELIPTGWRKAVKIVTVFKLIDQKSLDSDWSNATKNNKEYYVPERFSKNVCHYRKSPSRSNDRVFSIVER